MLAKLFAYFGFARARKWDAQAMQARLSEILEYLEGADTPLEESDYAFVEKFYPASLLSEYRKEFRTLRRKFTIIGCKLGHIECSQLMSVPLTQIQIDWLAAERKRTRRKSHPSLAFAEKETVKDDISTENEILPGSLADFRGNAGVRSTDGG